jgi:hypothetical protein
MRVIRPFSTATLTAVLSSPPMSIRKAGDTLSLTALASKSSERAAPIQDGRHPFRSLDRTSSSDDQAASVGNEDDVRGEDVEKALQVAVSHNGKEPVHRVLLLRR